MAVSKRLRFEVLRRDQHTCRYCGRKAPEVQLTVDHVVPQALGGDDRPTNLVAACTDCNSGKASVPANAPLVADVAADALRWSLARQLAAEMEWADIVQRNRAIADVVGFWDDAWLSRFEQGPPTPDDMEDAIGRWLDLGLTHSLLYHLIEVTISRVPVVPWNNLYKYFAGCCWNQLRDIETRAQAIVDSDD